VAAQNHYWPAVGSLLEKHREQIGKPSITDSRNYAKGASRQRMRPMRRRNTNETKWMTNDRGDAEKT
jgi:hypothetical protein